jgi:hypothetical protein
LGKGYAGSGEESSAADMLVGSGGGDVGDVNGGGDLEKTGGVVNDLGGDMIF